MSKQSDAEQLKILRYTQKHILPIKVGGIVMTQAQATEYRENFCPGCGSQMSNKITTVWFGEVFCCECVEKFERGEK